ncbi:hypothetical protein [Comamonas sp. lk]|uniref:hypothetical protein n=1 Tax=Comamonas sp. lk TaxID=2201272 RepID=UPI0013CE4716|nr:hypothetical protein [Comamonas sp. lk]
MQSNRSQVFLASIATALLFLAWPGVSRSQCSNSGQPSCDAYKSCFAKYCPCEAEADEYFMSYGDKYCRAFLGNTALSDAGKKWRESTMRCLQESIVPYLDISAQPKCNCRQMKRRAFDSHVACYTKQGASICDLPAGDVAQISKTIDVKDLFDKAGWKQMYEVSKICAQTAPEDGRRVTWKAVEVVLSSRM